MLLLESSKSGKTWKVVLIEKGLSKNGLYYPAEVLKKASHLFEKARAFFYEWKGKHFDHLPPKIEEIRPEGFPRQIAGWYDNVKYEAVNVDGREVEGLTALLHIHDGVKWLREMLTSSWEKGLKGILGLSINAEGPSRVEYIQGRPLRVVENINNVIGVDLVTHPAAGGQLVRLLASQNLNREGVRKMEWLKRFIESLKEGKPELLEGIDEENFSEEDANKLLTTHYFAQIREAVTAEAKAKGSSEIQTLSLADEAVDKAKEKGFELKDELLDEAIAEGVKANKEVEEGEFSAFEEARTGEATLKQVIGLLKAGKAALAMALLEKWLKAYPVKEAKKKEPYKKDKYPYKYPEAKKKAKKDEEEEEKESELEKKINEQIRRLEVKECKMILDSLLEDSNLPEPVRVKVRKGFEGKVFKETELKEAIKEERDVLAKLSESGDIIDLGDDRYATLNIGATRSDRFQAAMDLLIDPSLKVDEKLKESYADVDPFRSLRDAYVQITGDTEITGHLPRTRLREATTSDIPQLLRDAINKRLAREYAKKPLYYRQICDVISIKDFKTQYVTRYGGIGTLETVSETDDTDYPDIAFPADEEASYSPATKGGIIKITRRMIINDDLRALQQIPSKVSRAAARALNQFVFDLMLNVSGGVSNAGTYAPDGEGVALYAALHNNLGVDTLSFDGYSNRRTALLEQKEFGYEKATSAGLNDSELTLTFAAGGTNFKAGDYIQIEAEIMGPVTGTPTGTSVTVVARGEWGTTAATHALGKKAKVVSDDLDLSPGVLWVPSDLEAMALMIRNSEYVPGRETREINPYKNEFQVQAVPRSYMRGSTKNWVLTAKKGEIEAIELGFIGGREQPEIFLQDAPGVGEVFTRDVLRYKVRHEYGGAVVDYRAFQAYIA